MNDSRNSAASRGGVDVSSFCYHQSFAFKNDIRKSGIYMQRSWGLSHALVGLSLLGCASGGWSQQQFWNDPFKTDAKVTPAPGVEWQPRNALPSVPAPPVTPPPATAAPLTLAELTEYALRNNPRARQAWFAARAAAAGVGDRRSRSSCRRSRPNYALARIRPISGTTGQLSPWQTRYGPSVTLTLHALRSRARRSG